MSQLQPGYNFIPLQDFVSDIDFATAKGVNKDGIVIGEYSIGGVFFGFIWDTSKPVKSGLIFGIGYPGDSVAGAADPLGLNLNRDAFLGTRLLDINDNGVIVGRIDFQTPDLKTRSVAFQDMLTDIMSNLEVPGLLALDEKIVNGPGIISPTNFHAHGINIDNWIVGIYKDVKVDNNKEPVIVNGKTVPVTCGFLFVPNDNLPPGSISWDGGTFTRIDPPASAFNDPHTGTQLADPKTGTLFCQLYDINDSREMTGSCGPVSGSSLRNLAYWWESNLTSHAVDLSPLGDVGITFAINNHHQIAGSAVDSSKTTASSPINAAGVGWLSSINETKPSVLTPNLLQPPTVEIISLGPIKHHIVIPYGSVNVLGIGDNGWLLGNATEFPDPNAAATGAQAFIHLPLLLTPTKLQHVFPIPRRDPLIQPWRWKGVGPLPEMSPESHEIVANLAVSQAASQIADKKQRRSIQKIALEGALKNIRSLLSKLNNS